jgi:hypothetical protein
MPLTGGTPFVVANNVSYGFATSGTALYWSTWSGTAGSFFSAPVASVLADAGAPTTLTSLSTEARGACVDSTDVYWLDTAVRKMPINGSNTPMSVYSGPITSGIFVAVDSTSFYYTDYGAGTVVQVTPK